MFYLTSRAMVMRAAITLVLLFLTLAQGYAQETKLRVSPENCIALKKGQVCYQSVRVQFSTLNVSDYCLASSEMPEPIQCWFSSNEIDFQYSFASNKDIEFSMLDINGQTMAKARVILVWVYKQSRKRNRWRLF